MSDIFEDEDADESSLMTHDWKRMKSDRTKGGYREGVSEGHEARLQEGFNRGFQENLELGQSLGYMSGVLRGLLALKESQDIPHLPESSQAAMLSIIERIDRLKGVPDSTESTPHIGRSDEPSEHKSTDITATQDSSSSKDVGITDDVDQVRTDFKKLLEDINLSDIAM